MIAADIVGTIAAALSMGSLAPQVWKSIRSKSTRDLSMLWASVQVVSSALWATTGFLLGSIPIVVSDGTATLFAAALLVAKLRYDNRS